MEAKDEKRLKKFLKDNKITFKGEGSSLNSDCVIFSGFALWMFDEDVEIEDLYTIIENLPGYNKDYQTEFNRVFDYAYYNNYYQYWNLPEAKAKYKF